ncbi:TlpA family protein disulfide reductase [Gemmatimonadota bacterium]
MDTRRLIHVMCAGCLVLALGCDQGSTPESDISLSETAANSRIVVGAELPDFELSSLNDPNVSFTRSDLAGKTYLIDFWATWCLPCVAELPNLHRAYEMYGDRGFEILSVAMGDRREEIARLRQTELTMPWKHAFEPLDSEAAELFELFGVPMAILVDSSNTIVGLDEDVRGERLQETLARLFGESH